MDQCARPPVTAKPKYIRTLVAPHFEETTQKLHKTMSNTAQVYDPCQAPKLAAELCIETGGLDCFCIPQPVETMFVGDLTDSFRRTLAFFTPDDPAFCGAANKNVCG
jgi:hypothetical protein